MFAGALIGGVDAGGQLKVAAMTYRQGGNDFWPGPLDVNTATISPEECEEWDKHFKINRKENNLFLIMIIQMELLTKVTFQNQF